MLELLDHGLIFDATQQPPDNQIAFFVSLYPLQSGKILCGFQNGPHKNAATSTIRLCASNDGGCSWHSLPSTFSTRVEGIPGSLSSAEMVETSPGRLLLFATWFDRTKPDRPLFDPLTEGILRSKLLMAVSCDEGMTWSSWRAVPTGSLKGCACTGPVLRWNDGTLALPFESFKEFDDPTPCFPGSWIIVSHDDGQTFSSPLLVAQDPQHQIYYWDQRLCTGRKQGEFTALFWTHDRYHKKDLTVHLRHGTYHDGQICASPPRTTPIPGQVAAPLRWPDGRLLAFVVDRGKPCTMSLWSSSDDGQTWPPADRLVVYMHEERAAITQGQDNIDYHQYWEDMGKWSFGHPAIRQLDHHHALLAWYAGTPDRMSIHGACVRVSG